MMKHVSTWLLAALCAAALPAGVVFEIEVKDHEQSPPKLEETHAMAEGRNLKIDIAPGEGGSGGAAIFRGERREMVVVDDDEQAYYVIDQEAMRAIAGQVNQAMSQVQEALKNVPEDQRAMFEKMMKERMPKQPAAPQRPATELRKTGERETHGGYPCVKYEVLREGRKIREMWVTDWGNIEGGEEAADAFEEMADFFQELMGSIAEAAGGAGGFPGPLGGENVFEHMKELGGFPVVTREFEDDGSLESEATLRSARRQRLDPDAFEPPSGYKRRQMFPQ